MKRLRRSPSERRHAGVAAGLAVAIALVASGCQADTPLTPRAAQALRTAPASLDLGVGERAQISVRDSEGAPSVEWSSSDPEIAGVDRDGVVTGVAAGSTVITATSRHDPLVRAVTWVTVEHLWHADELEPPHTPYDDLPNVRRPRRY